MRSPIRRAAVARLLAAALVLPASLVTASEPGSGVYALDCASSDETYRISIRGDGSAEVQLGETTFMELLTSYSSFGNRTPNNFLVAVLFDPEASPIAAGPDGSPRIELWSGESAYFALINGDTKRRLDYCGPLGTPGAAADMPYSTDEYDAVGYLDCQLAGSEIPRACPFGIDRGDAGSASLTIQTPFGKERTLNHATGSFTDPSGDRVSVQREGHLWRVTVGEEHYEIPNAALMGD
ncbi:hypothetical protein ThimaDRAFT_0606 [Thiocapsa marina 5811]|uniref:Secreted protein n=2 Tax=Thiocapsa marina TaxID=244573 RepID=F9U6Q4_9GAMM|nr:hypothetical protein ThimaDRAFT_0606 [Thiocapsa marina 5811]